MSAASLGARLFESDWLNWLRQELAPSPERKVRTAILVGGTVLCVIISMTLEVPEVALTCYMFFFMSKETKFLTTLGGVIAVIGWTVGIIVSLLLYKVTYGYPEFRIPGMAIMLFLGIYLSRVFVIGSVGFLLGFVIAYSQSIAELVPSPELLVRGLLWLWVAVAYGVALTVVLNGWFLPTPTGPAAKRTKPKGLFKPDALTNPAHVRFALKVTFAGMFCYILYTAIDWAGIHTAFITCIFISLGSTEATMRKGTLRITGCLFGGAIALFSTVFLIPHMETIASLIVLVAAVSAPAAWIAVGSERISYAGLQMAFAFFLCIFQDYAPSTDLDEVRDRFVGIVFGLVVTGLVFQYIWPERARLTPKTDSN